MTLVQLRRWIVPFGLGLVLLASVALALIFFVRKGDAATSPEAGEKHGDETRLVPISVKTVNPRLDKDFAITVSRPCDVEAYYRVPIESKVSGEVQSVFVALGSPVEKDQEVMRVSRPDLAADEREKASIVRQRERETQLAQARADAARGAVKTARANLDEKKTLLAKADAETIYCRQVFDRKEQLWRERAIDKNVRDEAEKHLSVALANEKAADASRVKAEAEVEDAQANVKVMEADVERSRQMIEVARANDEQAQAQLEFTRVKSRYRGTIVERKVDPGSFVQNASTGQPKALLMLERTDIVTVVMRVPDTYASFVTEGTEAIIQVNKLPGVKIHGKVTRFARSLVTTNRDRTMRVEVDLWNGSPDEYQRFLGDPRNLVDLKKGPLPLIPEFTGKNRRSASGHLMADVYGKMTLVLKSFSNTHLIPSQAIIYQGGRTYLYIVQDGKAHRIPVEVEVDDGNLVKVVLLDKDGEAAGELTGAEEVIVSNQEELTEGQPVQTTPMEDWSGLEHPKVSH